MDKQKAQQLRQDLDHFLETTTALVGEFRDRIDLMAAETKQAQNEQCTQNGILLDYKTFSEVVNALACAVGAGDAGVQATYEKLVALGKAADKQELKPTMAEKSELPQFVQDMLDDLEAGKREAKTTSSEDADIKQQIKNQFQCADVKIVNNPLELLALLGALSELKHQTGRRF